MASLVIERHDVGDSPPVLVAHLPQGDAPSGPVNKPLINHPMRLPLNAMQAAAKSMAGSMRTLQAEHIAMGAGCSRRSRSVG